MEGMKRYRCLRYGHGAGLRDDLRGRLVLVLAAADISNGGVQSCEVYGNVFFRGIVSNRYIDYEYSNLVNSMAEAVELYGGVL